MNEKLIKSDVPTNKCFKDITGIRYGLLTVIRYVGRLNHGSAWLCKCECGNEKIATLRCLRSGNVKSCGCLRYNHISKLNKTHGKTRTSIYRSWQMMKNRCLNKNFPKYKDYGERGIKICDRWKNSFENFYYDMGDKPGKNYSIERHDNNGDYKYSNCYWASNHTQSKNRRLQTNNKTKISGVSFRKGGYSITIGSKYIGHSCDFFEACCIRKSAEHKLGYNENHGKR